MAAHPKLCSALAAGVMALAAAARADVVVLKSGDRISGKIISADGGKLVVTPDFDRDAKLTVALADVATFSTVAPVTVTLKDGQIVDAPMAPAAPGEVRPDVAQAVPPPSVRLADVATINPPPPPPAWTGTIAASGMYARATTDSASAGLSASATHATKAEKVLLGGAFNYGLQTTAGVTSVSADNWFASGEYDRFVSKQLFGYVSGRTEGDRANLLTLRATPAAGFGYQWVDRPELRVSLQGGLAWIYEDYRTTPEAAERLAAHAGYHLETAWDGKRLSLFHDLTVTPTLTDGEVLVRGDAGLKDQINHKLYSTLTLNAAYDTQPAPGARDLTTQLKFGLGYAF